MLKAVTTYANVNLHEKMTMHTACVRYTQPRDMTVFGKCSPD